MRRHCEGAGFTRLELRCYEPVERMQRWYFLEPLRWWPDLYARVVDAAGRPEARGMLSFRAVCRVERRLGPVE